MSRDHGGGIDAAVSRFGGLRAGWLDLSTGINPCPYPARVTGADAWTALPDQAAMDALLVAARHFWQVPDACAIVPAPGASALIATIPGLFPAAEVGIETPTYNEHAAAFDHWGWRVTRTTAAMVAVHPNNPDGRLWKSEELRGKPLVIDESFCDPTPALSHVSRASEDGVILLKSFGKFWGLAGLRLGFAICLPDMAQKLTARLGPWAVSGPALEIGAAALRDANWAENTRRRLRADAERLDELLDRSGLTCRGGTPLFRLAETQDAAALQAKLAAHHIWTRIFPYSRTWVRFGLPGDADGWHRLEEALA